VGADAADLALTIHPYPYAVRNRGPGLAFEGKGTITDLYLF
jgi:hypothetical protein